MTIRRKLTPTQTHDLNWMVKRVCVDTLPEYQQNSDTLLFRDNFKNAAKFEKIQRNYSGITSNPPLDVVKTFKDERGKIVDGPCDNRNGKNFPVLNNSSWRHKL
mgnify:CR=1 FL=1